MVLIIVLIIKAFFLSLIFSFLRESTLTSSQVHSTISYFTCLGWRTCHVVLELRRGGAHQSAVSRVLILTPVSWFGPLDSDHCHGQSHSCSIQPHHLPILTDYCLMATKTKRKRKGTKIIRIMCPEINTLCDQNFSFKWHDGKDYFYQILGNQIHMMIRNQKLDVAVVVVVFVVCFGFHS